MPLLFNALFTPLDVAGVEAPLPTEFKIFSKGRNASEKGSVLFDERAAAAVMRRANRRAVDFPVDLEHESLEKFQVRDDMSDARGWYSLELRNGELWAVNVTWTADGEDRLRNKKQRYISPAFERDRSGRIVNVINCALTALPATHDAQALVAASSRLGWQTRGARVRANGYLSRARKEIRS